MTTVDTQLRSWAAQHPSGGSSFANGTASLWAGLCPSLPRGFIICLFLC
ncbi:mCG147392 [Mus musculus]|nr:mCG147392 [Mus musculus]